MSKQGIRITVTVPIIIYLDEEEYVARCPAFQISSQGNTIEEAQKNIEEAMELLIEDCIESGTLEEELRACGWKPMSSSAKTQPVANQLSLPQTQAHVNNVTISLPAYSMPDFDGNTAILCPA